MYTTASNRYFAGTYAQARQKFLAAAQQRAARVESFLLESKLGAYGETLTTDIALLGPSQAEKLLIVSSGTHGPEGFCGSGCQVALLQDDELLGRLTKAGVSLLLIHAVNPYGFSHLRRTNEDNIDLNRNFMRFDAPLPANAAYADVEPFVLPPAWPPAAESEQAMAAYVARHGMDALRDAVSSGQYTVPDGIFYGGRTPSWSNRTIRAILRSHAAAAMAIGWIDIHTGLGPYGHGEKIYAGGNNAQDLARARAWWGADVFAPFEGLSASADVQGALVLSVYEECPQAKTGLMGLEFGTLPHQSVMNALRADHWLHRNPQAPVEQQLKIRQDLRDAFYCDNDEWKGMVLGQARSIMLQTLQGLKQIDG
ncbi:M14 family metallopeptidase [Variovorax terrae]|uniref:M14 family metallopeptidase n=1 Tax=Variovorax terrae TaxID=2923278 RepID=A0A9X1VRM2_9BURK|nr:M14 family metallopeptidase [Variovorax terrae]MCJ0762556.1 M14 family metallopeptidase [Variovorax terrae]